MLVKDAPVKKHNLSIAKISQLKNDLTQVVKYFFVGVSNVIVSLSVYYLFIKIDEKLYLVGNVVGWAIGVTNAFFWNHRFVFPTAQGKQLKTRQRFIKTYIAYLVSLIISTGLLYLVVNKMCMSKSLAPVINLLIITPMNYFISRFWTYKD